MPEGCSHYSVFRHVGEIMSLFRTTDMYWTLYTNGTGYKLLVNWYDRQAINPLKGSVVMQFAASHLSAKKIISTLIKGGNRSFNPLDHYDEYVPTKFEAMRARKRGWLPLGVQKARFEIDSHVET